MKKVFLILSIFLTKFAFGQTPLLNTSPGFLNEVQAGNIVITCNSLKGNTALSNFTVNDSVFVHIGVITNMSTGSTDWRHVLTQWTTMLPSNKCNYIGNQQWTFTVPGDLRTYFGVTGSEKIHKIAILFHLGNTKQANSDGSDMFIPVDTSGNLQMRFNLPPTEPRYNPWPEPITATLGSTLPIEIVSNNLATNTIFLNGVNIGSNTNSNSLLVNPLLTQPCSNQIMGVSTDGVTSDTATLNFFISNGLVNVASLPIGVQDGINYHTGDTSVTLVLYAPNKNNVVVQGSHNNWFPTCDDLMNKTPDGLRFWKTINGLTPGQIYKFQYLVDGNLTTTDPYCELILDPWNDQYINSSTFPNMPTYPNGQTGIVGTFQTAKPDYTWVNNSFTRPDKYNLMVYELLLRDFISTHNWNGLIDTLDYLKNLGINCIELMPFTEFEGNESWGYNPDFIFAVDKYYGPENDLKKFIDIAHGKGMAVVLDAVLNQATGLSPFAQLYWNNSTNKPDTSNPWLNVDATHPFNVFNDFNHESQATKNVVYRYMRHWLKDFKLDGFRWDLAKGFTQTNSGTNITLWGNYDASRVAIWKNYYDSMMAIEPNTYCILEFFGVDQEESEYANYGMLNWAISHSEFAENTKGTAGSKSISRAYYKNRTGYNVPGIITYAESHDEERIQFKNETAGAISGSYNIKNVNTSLKRQEAMHALMLMIPGPKMIWQFGELGYDTSIFYCPINGSNNSNCKLDNKPILWNYYQVPERKKIYAVISAINKLRKMKPNLFTNNTIQTTGTDLGNNFIKKIVMSHTDLKAVVMANFDLTAKTITQPFPANGKWYSYLGSDSFTVNGLSRNFTLQPGEYRIYLDSNYSQNINVVNGIQDFNIDNIFSTNLFPNPTENESILEINSMLNGQLNIQLLDVTGKIVHEIYNGKILTKTFQKSIATNHLSKGIYFVKIDLNGLSKMLRLEVRN